MVDDEISYIGGAIKLIKTGSFEVTNYPPMIVYITSIPLRFIPNLEDSIYMYNNSSLQSILMIARMPIVFLSIILGIIIFVFTSEFFNKRAGVFALFLYVLEPNIIAFSRICYQDILFSFFFVSSIFLLWKLKEKPANTHMIMAGITLGFAHLSRFISLLIVFIGLIYCLKIKDKKIILNKIFLKRFLITILISLVIIEIGYLLVDSSIVYYFISLFEFNVSKLTAGFDNFLLGEVSNQGWIHYYLISFMIKTPAPIIILLGILTYLKVKSKKLDDNTFFMLIPIIIFFIFFSFSKFQRGIRYLLPIYPLLIVLISNLINKEFKYKRLILVSLSVWLFISTTTNFPNYISYFNELIGGPQYGYLFVSDSSIDIGQDIFSLREYMTNNPDSVVIGPIAGHLPFYSIPNVGIPTYVNYTYTMFNCNTKENVKAISNFSYLAVSNYALFINKQCSWLKEYLPTKTIGNSIYLFRISELNEN